MLQRVGIASALVNEPDLVVLDEPLSGLDPIGRKEMRDIVVGLRAQGRTIFFSSHILSDAELICDKVAIIHRGVLRSVGALADLVDQERVSVEIVVDGLTEVGEPPASLPAAAVERIGRYLRLTVHESQADAVLRAVLDAGGRIETVLRKRESLEDLFLRAAVRS
jgi:ABC-2 type transport system ATP-binding protein